MTTTTTQRVDPWQLRVLARLDALIAEAADLGERISRLEASAVEQEGQS